MASVLNHASSDKSYSTPTSRASTRDTTPEFSPSAAAAAVNGFASMRICGMEPANPFQAGDHRYSADKTPVMLRRLNQPQHHHQQQQHQVQQIPMRHVFANAAAPRSLDAPSWRMGMGMGSVQSQAQAQVQGHDHGHYHTLSSASVPEYMVMGSPVVERQVDPGRDSMGVDTSGFFAYCLDRGNGNYTRLVPADLLPPLVGIPAVQHGAEGMLVLPAPRGPDPQNPTGGPVQPVTFKTPPPSPAPVSDALQKRIDHIVASSPAPPKKPKVYCDKWVHEGVCAFTQQGCKYKHEMPLDKATQHSLGLFHGLPTWWKKQQAELQRQQQQQQQQQQPPPEGGGSEAFFEARQPQQAALPSPVRSERGLASPARASQSWRRVESVKVQGQLGSMSPVRQNASGYRTSAEPRSTYQQNIDSPTSPCVWGPIGPPSKQTPDHNQMYHQNLGGFGGSNNFALLASSEESMDDRRAGSRFGAV